MGFVYIRMHNLKIILKSFTGDKRGRKSGHHVIVFVRPQGYMQCVLVKN